MEHGKRETGVERPPRQPAAPESETHREETDGGEVHCGNGGADLAFAPALMMAGIFMMYVKTTLAPALDVRAEDYINNMSQSSSHLLSGSGQRRVEGISDRSRHGKPHLGRF